MLNILTADDSIILKKEFTDILSLRCDIFSASKKSRNEGYRFKPYLDMITSGVNRVKAVKKINKYDKNKTITVIPASEKKENILMFFKQSIMRYMINSFTINKVKKAIDNTFSEKINKNNLNDKCGNNNG